jgi:hypothetical protein
VEKRFYINQYLQKRKKKLKRTHKKKRRQRPDQRGRRRKQRKEEKKRRSKKKEGSGDNRGEKRGERDINPALSSSLNSSTIGTQNREAENTQNRGREYWVVVARWPSLFACSSPEQSPDKASFHLPFVLFESSLHLALCANYTLFVIQVTGLGLVIKLG